MTKIIKLALVIKTTDVTRKTWKIESPKLFCIKVNGQSKHDHQMKLVNPINLWV